MNIRVDNTERKSIDLDLGDIVKYDGFYFVVVKDDLYTEVNKYMLRNLMGFSILIGKHKTLPDLSKSLESFIKIGNVVEIYKSTDYELIIAKKEK